MRRFFLLLVAGILLLIVQTTWLSLFPVQRMRPDLLLIFTLYLAFLFPPFLGGILAFFTGYLMDLFSGNTLGLYAFSRTLVFFATQFLKERFYLEGFSFQFLFAFAFSFVEGGLLLAFPKGDSGRHFSAGAGNKGEGVDDDGVKHTEDGGFPGTV